MGKEMGIRHFRELIVWKKAMELVTEVYRITARFPESEKFGLVTQLRRAAVSVPSNIAEGQGRSSTGEFKQFLGHARGSLCEVDTQIEIAVNLGLLTQENARRFETLIGDVARLLNALIRSLADRTAAREDDAFDTYE